MKLRYVEKHVEVKDYLKEQVEKKLSKLDKYFKEDVDGTVKVSNEGKYKKVEVTIKVPKSILRAEETSEDILTAVDMAVDALLSQVRRYKTKLKKRYKDTESIRFESIPDDNSDVLEDEEVLRVKKHTLHDMTSEEAILQMNLLGHDFYMYRDIDTREIRVVYKRKTGGYGVISSEE